MLHSDGSLETLFSRADDANLMLGNDLVVDPADGSVYFTNTHNMFEVRSVAFRGSGRGCHFLTQLCTVPWSAAAHNWVCLLGE